MAKQNIKKTAENNKTREKPKKLIAVKKIQ